MRVLLTIEDADLKYMSKDMAQSIIGWELANHFDTVGVQIEETTMLVDENGEEIVSKFMTETETKHHMRNKDVAHCLWQLYNQLMEDPDAVMETGQDGELQIGVSKMYWYNTRGKRRKERRYGGQLTNNQKGT